MKIIHTALFAALSLAATPVFAQEGDAERGEAGFNQCQSCHVVRNDADEVLAGRNGRTGPNLFGVIGRTAGTYPDFRYGDAMVAAGEAGLVWDEENFVAYLQDPTAFLREYTGNNRARGNMSFRLRSEEQARDMFAFLSTFSPDAEETEAAPASE